MNDEFGRFDNSNGRKEIAYTNERCTIGEWKEGNIKNRGKNRQRASWDFHMLNASTKKEK